MNSKRLSNNILPRSLGELELAILQVLWESDSLSAKAILQALEIDRKVGLSAIQSSLESLRNKNLLEYHKQRQAFVYTPIISRSELMGQFVGDIIQTLHDGKLDTILSSFVSVASKINDSALDELEKLIQNKRLENKTQTKEKHIKNESQNNKETP